MMSSSANTTVESFQQQKSNIMGKYSSADIEAIAPLNYYGSSGYPEPSYMNWNNFGNTI